ncbi:hypothetical protein [Streptomyces phaeochromogenes]
MTDHRPGEWPAGLRPVPASADPAPVTLADAGTPAAPEILVPEVRLVAIVDLTGRYDSASEVSADFHEQTRRSTDCHTAVVQLGDDALRHGLGLAHSIAARFYLSARCIEVIVPAGTLRAHLADEVRRNVRQFCADHEKTMSSLRNPG